MQSKDYSKNLKDSISKIVESLLQEDEFNKIWISPSGDEHPVPDNMWHSHMLQDLGFDEVSGWDYQVGVDAGWIRKGEHDEDGFITLYVSVDQLDDSALNRIADYLMHYDWAGVHKVVIEYNNGSKYLALDPDDVRKFGIRAAVKKVLRGIRENLVDKTLSYVVYLKEKEKRLKIKKVFKDKNNFWDAPNIVGTQGTYDGGSSSGWIKASDTPDRI